MSAETIQVSFHYMTDEDWESSISMYMSQVPRVGEHVVVIFGEYADTPYNSKLEGTVESVSWEVNSRRKNEKTDQVYVHLHFEGEVKIQPWTGSQ